MNNFEELNIISRNGKSVVASLIWTDQPDELHRLQGEVVVQLGHQHRFFRFDEPIPLDANIILIQGPYGTILPLIRQLVALPTERRPVLAYWFQQSLNILKPLWARKLLARTFSDLYRYYREAGSLGNILDYVAPKIVNSRGARLRFMGDIFWLHDHGLLDVLALSSSVYADYFAACGVPSLFVHRGYHPAYGSVLDHKRDVAVVWMGKTRTKRRRRALYWLREQLKKRGHVMHIYDGRENGFIFEEERMQILNRSWFVVNMFFSDPTNEISLRYYLAAANGAVVITEPGENRYPFTPGKHLVECPIKEMPDTIMHYLNHPEEWCALSTNMLNHIKKEITMEQSFANILSRAESALVARRRVSLLPAGSVR